MWGLFLLLVAFGDEPAEEPAKVAEPVTVQTLTDATPAQIADQLSDILAMLQAIPTDTTADDATASVDAAKADTKTVEEKAK